MVIRLIIQMREDHGLVIMLFIDKFLFQFLILLLESHEVLTSPLEFFFDDQALLFFLK